MFSLFFGGEGGDLAGWVAALGAFTFIQIRWQRCRIVLLCVCRLSFSFSRLWNMAAVFFPFLLIFDSCFTFTFGRISEQKHPEHPGWWTEKHPSGTILAVRPWGMQQWGGFRGILGDPGTIGRNSSAARVSENFQDGSNKRNPSRNSEKSSYWQLCKFSNGHIRPRILENLGESLSGKFQRLGGCVKISKECWKGIWEIGRLGSDCSVARSPNFCFWYHRSAAPVFTFTIAQPSKNRSRESQHLIRPFSMRLASSLSMIGILASINPVRRSWPCANPIGMFQHHFLFHADGWDHFHVGSFHYTLISGGIFHWAPSGASASLNAWPVASRPILPRLFPVAFIPSLLLLLLLLLLPLLLPHLVPK